MAGMFEGGLFYTLLAIGFILLLARIQYREYVQFLASAIFLVLGFVVYSGTTDIGFFVTTTDGTNVINQTNYILGNGSGEYHENGGWLALVLVLLGIISAMIAVVSILDLGSKPKNNNGGS